MVGKNIKAQVCKYTFGRTNILLILILSILQYLKSHEAKNNEKTFLRAYCFNALKNLCCYLSVII